MVQSNLWGLWPHQEEAIAEIETAWRSGARAVCYQCPTGAGKTRILRQIVDNHAQAKKVIYIIAHRKNLVSQLSEEIHATGIRHGIIAAGYPRIRYRVQVASLQTLTRRVAGCDEPGLIVIDEAHHVKSESYMRVINAWPAALILGVTATPQRLDGRPMSDVFQRLIIGPTVRDLIDGGYLADYEYFAPQQVEAPEHMYRGEYRLDEVATLMDKGAIIGNAVEHYRRHAAGLPTIASCASIAHAEHVAAGFRAAGYRAQAVHSGMAQTDIDHALGGLRTGAVQVITQCELLGEGIDIPGATVLIGLRHTASLTIFLQHIGRVLRRADGKRHAVILDHVGNWLRHGLPDDPRQWSLDGRAAQATDETPLKRCPECFHIVPRAARACDFCEHIWEQGEARRELPDEADGTLAAVRRPRVRIGWKELIDEIRERARTQRDAIAIAQEYGYRHTAGWTVWRNVLRK